MPNTTERGSIRFDESTQMWTAHCPACQTKHRAESSVPVYTWAAIHLRRHGRP
jgi:hypothetical protein